jgi:hypothetical protein
VANQVAIPERLFAGAGAVVVVVGATETWGLVVVVVGTGAVVGGGRGAVVVVDGTVRWALMIWAVRSS